MMNDTSIPQPAAAQQNVQNTSYNSSNTPSQMQQQQQQYHQPTSSPPQQPPPPIPSQQQPNVMYSGAQAGSGSYMNMPPSIPPQQYQQQPQQQFQYNNNQYNPNPQQWQQQQPPPNMAYNYPPNPQAYPQSSQYAYQQPYTQNPQPQFNTPYSTMPQQPLPIPSPAPPQSAAWIGSSSMPNTSFAGNQGNTAGASRFSKPSSVVGDASTVASNMSAAARALRRPPYIDPTTHIAYDVDNPDYEGWLTKQSAWMKEWRRRYFILKGSKLFFCKHPTSGAPHGMMDLSICTTVKSADLKSGKRHSFEISTPDTIYLLYADTEAEKDDWIGRVGKAIVRCSRTYYKGESTVASNNQNHQEDDDDDIYENDDPDSPYFND